MPETLPRDDTIPQSLPEFMRRFGTDAKCERVLRRWRYPDGFRCPACGHDQSWFLDERRLDECNRPIQPSGAAA